MQSRSKMKNFIKSLVLLLGLLVALLGIAVALQSPLQGLM